MIKIGTAGYSFDDWKRHFYPPLIKSSDMLSFYSKYFETVEINSSFYKIPPVQMIESIMAKVPPEFEFLLKVYKGITHEKNPADIDEFKNAIAPLIEKNKLSALLFQFPYSFNFNEENKQFLLTLKDNFQTPIIIEFRNTEWINDDVFKLMEENNLGYCCVDEPRTKSLVPPVARVTSEIGYLRFHGRNIQNWFHPEQPSDRYDYLYNEEELKEWLPKIKAMAELTKKFFIIFNNHPQAKAVKNAALFSKLLELKDIKVPTEEDYDQSLGRFL